MATCEGLPIPKRLRSGLCECGCGQTTNISTETDPSRGAVKGEPRRFVMGHNTRKLVTDDYRKVRVANSETRVHLHRVRAERALGKALPERAVVHHADGTKGDNSVLVICQDQAYHMLLHARMRIRMRGGNPNTDSYCGRCRTMKPREAFYAKAEGAFGVANTCCACKSEIDHADYLKRIGKPSCQRHPKSKHSERNIQTD